MARRSSSEAIAWLLFSAGDAGAIFIDPSLDITGEVIKRFAAAKPATAKPAAAPTTGAKPATPPAAATQKPAAPATPPAAPPATQKPAAPPAKP